MSQLKARAIMERDGVPDIPFGNPEVTAMAEICEILRKLPDDDARQRVMRWSFGRFNPDFRRLGQAPAPAPVPSPEPALVAAATSGSEVSAVARLERPAALTAVPIAATAPAETPGPASAVSRAPEPVAMVAPEPAIQTPPAAPAGPLSSDDLATEIAAVAPDILTSVVPRRSEPTDFGRELSELEDLFTTPRPRNGSARDPLSWDGF